MVRRPTDDDDPTQPLGRLANSRTRPDGSDAQSGLLALPEPLRLQLESGEEVSVGHEPFTLGRSPRNRVVLDDFSVSRLHCRATPLGDELFIEGLAPDNWVKVNDEPVWLHYLRVGDRLQLGSITLRLLAGEFNPEEIRRYGIVGRSHAMQEVRDRIARVASRPETVLILGETGTGKELVAKAIHVHSGRRGRFVTINCAELRPELAEAELLGYEEGAFTGAVRGGRDGKFVEADGGTLFLDEIGDLDPKIQAMILRVAEDKVVRRIQSKRERTVDVRIVAATNNDLRTPSYVGMGPGKGQEFRRDLYERLASAVIRLPPLRDHMEDLPLLLVHLRDQIPESRAITSEAFQHMVAYRWPDNVRELKRRLTNASVFCKDSSLGLDDLFPSKRSVRGPTLRRSAPQQPGPAPGEKQPTPKKRAGEEQIREALAKHGNADDAAKATGRSRATVFRYQKKFRGSGSDGDGSEGGSNPRDGA
jgi:DNA-binding NtrC family response regulator